jgi:hypothetical protein
MQEHIMKAKGKSIAKIERDNITLMITADNGSQSVKNCQKKVIVNLVLVKPFDSD